MAFHFFRFRKFSVKFTTVQLILYPDLLRLTFQRKTEWHLGTRLASTLCTNVWFNLTCYHSPTRHTPGDLQFFLSWWSMPQPRARKKRQFSTPELLIDLIYLFFWYIFLRALLISVQRQTICFQNFYKRFLEFMEGRIINI